MLRALSLFSLLAVVDRALGQAPFDVVVIPPTCTDILIDQFTSIGTVCSTVAGENLEVTKEMTGDFTGVCCIETSHICNLPALQLNPLMVEGFCPLIIKFAVDIEEIYDFVCTTGDDTFLVAGHVEIMCTVDIMMPDGNEVNRRLQATGLTDTTMENGATVSSMSMQDMDMKDPYKFNAYYEIPLACN